MSGVHPSWLLSAPASRSNRTTSNRPSRDSTRREGDPSAAEMAEAQRLPLTIVHGKCRMLSQRGWVAANRDGHRLRYSLAVPATEIDLG